MIALRRPAAALIAVALMGCKKPPPEVSTADAAVPLPIDHLAQDEVPEGGEKAFGLPLPKGSRVRYRLHDVVEAESRFKPEDVSNYMRARVGSAKISTGAQTTSFTEVSLASEPKRRLTIEVRPTPASVRGGEMRTTISVRDVTPPPPAPKTSDQDAWEQAGRRPDGKPLDPKHLF